MTNKEKFIKDLKASHKECEDVIDTFLNKDKASHVDLAVVICKARRNLYKEIIEKAEKEL